MNDWLKYIPVLHRYFALTTQINVIDHYWNSLTCKRNLLQKKSRIRLSCFNDMICYFNNCSLQFEANIIMTAVSLSAVCEIYLTYQLIQSNITCKRSILICQISNLFSLDDYTSWWCQYEYMIKKNDMPLNNLRFSWYTASAIWDLIDQLYDLLRRMYTLSE